MTEAGHDVTKVAFTCGDIAYCLPKPSILFRESVADLPDFLDAIYQRNGITDQVLFGDRRPHHVVAIGQARVRGIRNHVFEEGYFRPYWITLEREGVNARSALPRTADWYRRAAAVLGVSSPVERFDSPFWRRAAHDVAYHAAGMLNPILFPKYRTHATVSAPQEYVGFVRRRINLKLRGAIRKDAAAIASLIESPAPYFFLPLQLDSDAQVRVQPELHSMHALISAVMRSFAIHAPSNAKLLIKNHPLDIGQVPYAQLIDKLADQLELRGRVMYVETGDLTRILMNATGTVTLNSTVGSAALEHGCPTIALADAIYRMPGLTAQCDLDDFWQERSKPAMPLFETFQRVVHAAAMVNGGYYCPKGIALASNNASNVIASEKSPLEQLFEQVSP